MRRNLMPWLLAAALFAAATSTADAGQFILRARSAADAQTLCQRYGLSDTRTLHQATASDEIHLVAAATQSAADVQALKAAVSADPLALAFEIDSTLLLAESGGGQISTSATLSQSTAAILEAFAGQPPVAYFGSDVQQAYVAQPAATIIRLPDAHALGTGRGIVAVIDTGVDPGHPAIAGVLIPGYDFINDVGGVPTDFAEISQSTAAILEQLSATTNSVALLNQSTAAILEQSTAAILESAALPAAFGHGTMVAGLVHLVAPSAFIMPLKAFRADGSADMADLVAAIYYAVDNGATVINMSFTLVGPSQALLDAISYAASRHVLLVAAMGNDGQQITTYPAAWPGVIAVASTNPSDQRSVFSNYGSRVDLSAPGEALITPYPGNHYAAAWGTSFATALVTGAVSLVQQFAPQLNEADALKILDEGAEVPSYLGKARIDAYHALHNLLYNSY